MGGEPLLEDVTDTLNAPLLQIGDLAVSLAFLIKVALLIVAILAVAAFVRRRLVFRLLSKSSVDDGVKYAMARIAAYVVWVIGLLIGLPIVGIKLNSLFVAFGAIGIGIGLGLQKIAENFISGLLVLLGRPVKVGDRIRVGDHEGTIVEIQSRVTLLRTNDNVIVLVPNSKLISDDVVNLTHNDKVVRFGFDVGVSYLSDPKQVRECLLDVARANPAVLAEPEPDVLFRSFGDSSLNFRLRAYSRSMVHTPDVLTSQINFAIWDKLAEAGINIPFPQRDLHIKSMPPALEQPES